MTVTKTSIVTELQLLLERYCSLFTAEEIQVKQQKPVVINFEKGLLLYSNLYRIYVAVITPITP